MAYVLDPSKAETRFLSNDAFFWLKDEEEPLDESNLEEAEEIMQMFPNGFVIDDNWDYEKDEPDTIRATFIPYVQDNCNEWDGETRDAKENSFSFRFKVLAYNKCYARWSNDTTGKVIFEGECEVKYYASNPWAYTPNKSSIPLWGQKCIYFTNKRFTYNNNVSKCVQIK